MGISVEWPARLPPEGGGGVSLSLSQTDLGQGWSRESPLNATCQASIGSWDYTLILIHLP